MIQPSRRGFLGLIGVGLAAPLIVRATSIMPVKAMPVAPNLVVFPEHCFSNSTVTYYTVVGRDEYGNFRSETFLLGPNEEKHVVSKTLALSDGCLTVNF
jgi:hypothetical protein